MQNAKNEMFDLMSQYLTKSAVYEANANAKVSAFILKRRHELNMTQKEFAKMMGVTQAMVSKWESVTYNFTLENIAQIAAKLHTSFEINFVPESEYLLANDNNHYESTIQDSEWEEKCGVIRCESAA